MKRKKQEHKFSFLRLVLLGLVALILGLCIYSFNAESLIGNKMPMPFGYGCSVVMSGSMEPELQVDDLVIIKETKNIKVNDVVVFQENNSLIIHRVLEISGDEVITKGDANNMPDEPININSIKGVMTGRIPYVGAVVQIFKQPIVVFILLVLAVLLTEVSFRREKDKDTQNLDAIKMEIEQLLKDINETE